MEASNTPSLWEDGYDDDIMSDHGRDENGRHGSSINNQFHDTPLHRPLGDDDLNPARGILTGLVISVVPWGLLAVWWLLL